MTQAHDWPSSPAAALTLLLDGNKRFVAGERLHPNQDADYRASIAPEQKPFAVLFGCADSRLAAEIIFDRGLGDLFVVRTAGHVVGAEILGSIEYAISVLDTPLIAVLGHDSCGAINATLEALEPGHAPSGYIRDIVERVMLSVLAVRDEALADPEVAVMEHIRYTTELLVERSALIADRLAEGRVGVVGLSYRLAEGSVRRISGHGV
ncbi:carbonic anhydrase [Catelliglobosispora koreensis]|uniref:carbonic anhydrase n=1 Tax=Catelliglobosispora koreensis TaxID=129052 RepID=UPI00036FCE4D|nr:carbonic anhydrase [Catelliglobosispora koreensis]